MTRARGPWLVATILAAGAVTLVASAGSRAPIRLHVRVPSAVGFSFGRFEILPAPGSSIPARAKLVLLNRATLPKGLIAVAAVGRRGGGKPGLDVFVTLIRERTSRSLAEANPPPGDDAVFGIIAAATVLGGPTRSAGEQLLLLRKFVKAPDTGKVNQPAGEQPVAALVAQPGVIVQLLDGPPNLDYVKLMNDDAGLVELLATREPEGSLLTDWLEKIEQLIHNDLNGDGAIGPPPPKPPPKQHLFTYAFSGLQVSFDGPNLPNIGRAHVAETFSGSGCGTSLSSSWKGSIDVQAPGVPMNIPWATAFPSTNPYIPYTWNSKDANGTLLGQVQTSLDFVTGSAPHMTIRATPSGDIANLVVGSDAAVSVTPAASC